MGDSVTLEKKERPGPDEYTARRVLGLMVILTSIVAILPLERAGAPTWLAFVVVFGGIIGGLAITGD